MIKVESVSKSFGIHRVIDNVSLDIKSGEIVGFLGQNGAGKTTLMRILTGYLQPDRGRVHVAGLDVQKQSLALHEKIGYLPETPPLYMNMTVKDYLFFAARLKNVAKADCSNQIDRVLNQCDLSSVYTKTIGKLSKGFKQRVGIAQAIINNPPILILDEPTSGLDPVQVQYVRRLIRSLEESHTVLLSTHVLSELEQMAQRILLIHNGRILFDDSLQNIVTAGESLESFFLQQIGYTNHG